MTTLVHDLLFLQTKLMREMKESPPDIHHFSFTIIYYRALYNRYGCFRGGKQWGIAGKFNMFTVACFWCSEMHDMAFQQ